MANNSVRKAGNARLDFMRRQFGILLFRSIVMSSHFYPNDKSERIYNRSAASLVITTQVIFLLCTFIVLWNVLLLL